MHLYIQVFKCWKDIVVVSQNWVYPWYLCVSSPIERRQRARKQVGSTTIHSGQRDGQSDQWATYCWGHLGWNLVRPSHPLGHKGLYKRLVIENNVIRTFNFWQCCLRDSHPSILDATWHTHFLVAAQYCGIDCSYFSIFLVVLQIS